MPGNFSIHASNSSFNTLKYDPINDKKFDRDRELVARDGVELCFCSSLEIYSELRLSQNFTYASHILSGILSLPFKVCLVYFFASRHEFFRVTARSRFRGTWKLNFSMGPIAFQWNRLWERFSGFSSTNKRANHLWSTSFFIDASDSGSLFVCSFLPSCGLVLATTKEAVNRVARRNVSSTHNFQ